MAATKKRPRVIGAAPKPNQQTSPKPSAPPAEPEERRKVTATCPVCHGVGKLDFDFMLNHHGEWRWFANCWSPSCQELGRGYVSAAAVAAGAKHGYAFLADPLKYVEVAPRRGGSSRLRPRGEPPVVDVTRVRMWTEQLLARPDVLDYLRVERGLNRETVAKYSIGYDGAAITLPVFERGLVRNVKRRYWPAPWLPGPRPIWKRGMLGSRAQLYPDVPDGPKLLLVEGEFDALLARQHGFAGAVTSTTGTSWSQAWDSLIVGRRVAILYDAGSLALAQRRAEYLVAAGAEDSWAVDLAKAGLEHKGDDLTDWFVKYGHTAGDLLALIRGAT
jgi:hypothetical protein